MEEDLISRWEVVALLFNVSDMTHSLESIESLLGGASAREVESGRTEPRLNTIAALAGSFGKTLSELLRGL